MTGEKNREIGGNLFVLDILPKRHTDQLMLMGEQRTLTEWHQALSHASEDKLKKTANVVEDMKITKPEDKIQCSTCPEGKGKASHHPVVNKRAETVGEIVHINLSGKVNKTSFDGSAYYLLCKDEFSEFVFVFSMKTKAEVHECLEKLMILFERDSGCSIKGVQTDNGSEFLNRGNELLFLKEKIAHYTSSPYTPQQNGLIEREMGYTTSMARTLLLASNRGGGGKLWPLAIESAVYIRNRLPTTQSLLTPFERFVGRKPKVGHLYKFGEQVHVVQSWKHLQKFDPRTEPGFIVGYTHRSNNYKVWLRLSQRVTTTSDVIVGPHKEVTNPKSPETMTPVEVGTQLDATKTINVPALSEVDTPASSADPDPSENRKVDERFPTVSTTGTDQGTQDNQKQIEEADRGTSDNDGTDDSDSSVDVNKTCVEIEKRLEEIRLKEKIQLTQEELLRQQTLLEEFFNRSRIEEAQGAEGICYPTLDRVVEGEEDRANPFQGRELPRSPTNEERNYSCCGSPNIDDTPNSFEDAVTGRNKAHWLTAIRDELEAHKINQTWEVVKRPVNKELLTALWVFAIKRDEDGQIIKHKARLVARGFEQ